MTGVDIKNSNNIISLSRDKAKTDLKLKRLIGFCRKSIESAIKNALDEEAKEQYFVMGDINRGKDGTSVLVSYDIGNKSTVSEDYIDESGIVVLSSKDIYDVTNQTRSNFLDVKIPDSVLKKI